MLGKFPVAAKGRTFCGHAGFAGASAEPGWTRPAPGDQGRRPLAQQQRAQPSVRGGVELWAADRHRDQPQRLPGERGRPGLDPPPLRATCERKRPTEE